MKLAFSTNAYTRHSLVDAPAGIKQAGFAGVEILADKPHAYPTRSSMPSPTEVSAKLETLGWPVSNINGNCSFGYWKDAPPEPYFEPSLISPNPKHRADRTRDDPADAGVRQGRRRGEHQHHQRPAAGRDAARAGGQAVRRIDPADPRPRRAARASTSASSASRGCTWSTSPSCANGSTGSAHPRLGANLDIGHSAVIGESIPDVVEADARPHLEPARRRHPRPQALPHDPRRGDVRLAGAQDTRCIGSGTTASSRSNSTRTGRTRRKRRTRATNSSVASSRSGSTEPPGATCSFEDTAYAAWNPSTEVNRSRPTAAWHVNRISLRSNGHGSITIVASSGIVSVSFAGRSLASGGRA